MGEETDTSKSNSKDGGRDCHHTRHSDARTHSPGISHETITMKRKTASGHFRVLLFIFLDRSLTETFIFSPPLFSYHRLSSSPSRLETEPAKKPTTSSHRFKILKLKPLEPDHLKASLVHSIHGGKDQRASGRQSAFFFFRLLSNFKLKFCF